MELTGWIGAAGSVSVSWHLYSLNCGKNGHLFYRCVEADRNCFHENKRKREDKQASWANCWWNPKSENEPYSTSFNGTITIRPLEMNRLFLHKSKNSQDLWRNFIYEEGLYRRPVEDFINITWYANSNLVFVLSWLFSTKSYTLTYVSKMNAKHLKNYSFIFEEESPSSMIIH